MAPTSAKLVTALILGEEPQIDAKAYACVG